MPDNDSGDDGHAGASADATALLICLPTYNEAGNLEEAVARIFAALPSARIRVIDDDSPDGTGALADRLAEGDARLRVVHRRRKEGLGRAYLDGFRRVLDETDAGAIGQMDADLSHPPERLPQMLRALGEADLVLGSRYVAGGGVEGWGWRRRLLSRFGCGYARLWTGLPVRDLTGGFKIWRREILRQVLTRPIRSDGYAFQVETTYVAARLGARVREVPIRFADREKDASKMSAAIAFEAFWKVPCLRRWYRGLEPDRAGGDRSPPGGPGLRC